MLLKLPDPFARSRPREPINTENQRVLRRVQFILVQKFTAFEQEVPAYQARSTRCTGSCTSLFRLKI